MYPTVTRPTRRRETQRDNALPIRGRSRYYFLGLMVVITLRLIVNEEFSTMKKLLSPVFRERQPTTTSSPPTTQSTHKSTNSRLGISPTPSDKGRKFCDASRGEARIMYFCEGPKYDSFSENLREYIDAGDSPIPERYGRSPFPFPSDSNILMFGNSHTRQLSTTLRCQYIDSITRTEYQLMAAGQKTDTMLTVFDNNATVVSLTNIPIPYSENWYKLIGDATGGRYELSDFDAIVLGMFNRYSNSGNTKFADIIDAFGVAMNVSDKMDFIHSQPPGLKAVTDHFSGPIVAAGMFATYGNFFAVDSRKTASLLEAMHNRTNLRVIDARKHVKVIGEECGSDVKQDIADCDEGGRTPQGMHRCTGRKGGHVDLIAWEVVDDLNQLFFGYNNKI